MYHNFLELPETSDTTGTSKSEITVAFYNTMCGTQYCEIDPVSCIPFKRIRETFQYCVQRLEAIFSGGGAS